MRDAKTLCNFYLTRISGSYGPFILAPADGCFGGPSAHHLDLWANNLIVHSLRDGQEGGSWEEYEGSRLETWGIGSSLMSWRIKLWPQEDNRKISGLYLYWKCVRKWGLRRGDLEVVEGTWPETWRTWSSLMSWMTFFYPREDTLKVLC